MPPQKSEVARAFYQYLLRDEFTKIDLTKIPATAERNRLIIATKAESEAQEDFFPKFLSYWCLMEKRRGGEPIRTVLAAHFMAELSTWLDETGRKAPKNCVTLTWLGHQFSKYSKLGKDVTGVSESTTIQPGDVRGRKVDYLKLELYLTKQESWDKSALDELDSESIKKMERKVAERCECKQCGGDAP